MKITGKDLIIIIAQFNLMDMPIEVDIANSDLYLTAEQAALKLGISVSSLLDMAKLGIVETYKVDDGIYFPKNVEIKRR